MLDEKGGETFSGFPAFLPDGKRFLARVERDSEGEIDLASLDSTERTPILTGVVSAPLVAATPNGET